MSDYTGIDIRDCRVAIGSRHTTDHVIRLDTSSGFYEELNAARQSMDADRLQTALMTPYRGGGGLAWRVFRAALCLGAFAAIGVLLAWQG